MKYTDHTTRKTVIAYTKIIVYLAVVLSLSMIAAFYALTELVQGYIG